MESDEEKWNSDSDSDFSQELEQIQENLFNRIPLNVTQPLNTDFLSYEYEIPEEEIRDQKIIVVKEKEWIKEVQINYIPWENIRETVFYRYLDHYSIIENMERAERFLDYQQINDQYLYFGKKDGFRISATPYDPTFFPNKFSKARFFNVKDFQENPGYVDHVFSKYTENLRIRDLHFPDEDVNKLPPKIESITYRDEVIDLDNSYFSFPFFLFANCIYFGWKMINWEITGFYETKLTIDWKNKTVTIYRKNEPKKLGEKIIWEEYIRPGPESYKDPSHFFYNLRKGKLENVYGDINIDSMVYGQLKRN